MKEEQEIIWTNVLLVGVDTGEEQDFEHSMGELASLAGAAYKRVAGIIVQRMETVNKAMYIGSGKVAEVREYAKQCGAEEIVFDNALSPSQIRNLSNEIELPILDRTNLILDIFAIRARTGEAKLQVETARLQYMLPRLVGMRENLSRQGGTGGSMSNKGAGETKLELDRRKIEHRISELKKELSDVVKNRATMRKKREQSRIPQVALVGYTNAGKSTIMNRLVERYGESRDKLVLEKDMLFATLDTNVRLIRTDDNRSFFLADTVGFINKLPHGLIKAFQSTLEEVKYADLLVQVVDFSDEHHKQHLEVTKETLKEIGAGDIPQIIVYNKADLCGLEDIPKRAGDRIYMAAGCECGLEELLEMIDENIRADWKEETFLIPFNQGGLVSYFMENAVVLEKEYLEEGVMLRVSCHVGDADKYSVYRYR
ncbi:MAG: GTPase HflX [Acetatifactor sp.]